MLELRTLGQQSLASREGREVRSVLAQPKRMALLAYLASPSTPPFVARETLLGMFWADRDQDHARNALRSSLHFLRRSLGPGVLIGRGEQEVGVDPRHIRCDAAEFDAALSLGDAEGALELYGGEYLPGMVVQGATAFTEWLEGERRRLNGRACDAARGLARGAEERRSFERAEAWARRTLTLDPWDEAALGYLMKALAAQGRRAEVLREYRDFASRLHAGLELEPSAATAATAAELAQESGIEALDPGGPAGGESADPVASADPTSVSPLRRDASAAERAAGTPGPARRNRRSLLRLAAAIGMIALVLGGVVRWTGRRQGATAWVARQATFTGDLQTSAISRDGRYIASTGGTGPGNMTVRVRDLESSYRGDAPEGAQHAHAPVVAGRVTVARGRIGRPPNPTTTGRRRDPHLPGQPWPLATRRVGTRHGPREPGIPPELLHLLGRDLPGTGHHLAARRRRHELPGFRSGPRAGEESRSPSPRNSRAVFSCSPEGRGPSTPSWKTPCPCPHLDGIAPDASSTTNAGNCPIPRRFGAWT